MTRVGLGLRGKFVLALVVACMFALLPALLIGNELIDAARNHFGQAYARNFTQLSRDRIRAPVLRDLALSRLLAKSPALRNMLRDPSPQHRARFFEVAKNYLEAFASDAYFVANALHAHGYYFNQKRRPFNSQPLYYLDPGDPVDGWFFATLRSNRPYNINVNYDTEVKQKRVWINVLVKDNGEVIGLVGAALNLSVFLHDFVSRAEPGMVPLIVNDRGAIQAYPDADRIALNTAGQQPDRSETLAGLLSSTDPELLAALLDESRARPNAVVLREVRFDGGPTLLAMGYIPELHWHVATLVDLGAAQIVGTGWLLYFGLGAVVVLLVLLIGFGYSVERLMVRPLRALQHSAGMIARGDYETRLPSARSDEIGALGRAFSSMADQVQAHTAELEQKVRERTAALEASHAQIDDSIDYASLIQRATLPDRELAQVLGDQQYVLWKPRDVVGGDFYVFEADGDSFLLGIMDCAGHGVPGALMTMLARSAIDHALALHGPRDPARILQQTDDTLHHLLADARLSRGLATSTDAGLVYVDRRRGQLLFAGAAIHLFYSDGGAVGDVSGSRRPLGDRRERRYANNLLALRADTTYCLVTDGLFDQAGGTHGYGFGSRRFKAVLEANAHRPPRAQAAALEQALADYQGQHPQRDDVTVLWFRLD